MQPWAWLIANGHKDIENRGWRHPPKYRGPFLIHAGKNGDPQDEDFYHQLAQQGIQFPLNVSHNMFGGIVGVAEIIDVVRESKSPWFFGPLGFVIRNARPLPFMPCKGQLGFFDVEYREPADA